MSEESIVTPEVTEEVTPEVTPEPKETSKEPVAKEEPVKTAPSKRKVKAYGKEVEIDESEIDRYLSMGVGAQEKFQEAAKMRKEIDAFQKEWNENPVKALKNLKAKNPKIRDAVEEFLYDEIKEDELSPEQKELKKYKEKEQEEQATKKRLEEEAKVREQQETEMKYIQQFDKDLTAALTQHNIPKSPQFIKRVASYMADALDNDMELTPAEAVEHVKADYIRDLQHFIANIEDVLPWVGEEVAAKIRKADLDRVKASKASPGGATESKPKPVTKQYRTPKEMAEDALKMLEGL